MSEPRLEDIGDYDTLKGEKKKVVLAVIFAGLIMGIVYVIVANNYTDKEEMLEVEKTFKNIPMK